MVIQKGSTRYWNYLEDYWPCVGGLSAVNAIGNTQLRDPINSGLTRWRMHVLYVCVFTHAYSKSMDQAGKVANPVRGQLNRENEYFPVRVRA